MYEIKNYSFKKAEELSLNIKPSTRKNKKIDVYKQNDYLFSIGSIKNFDYPTYVIEKGKAYAEERKRLYHIRHKKDLKHFKGFVAMYILW
jgi:hypothetical protein